ncbi:phosphoribosylanthranilate isomerase [Streptomyces sp. HPF1205]|uniref:phosphoribosylanthranilate isomerase n=1 Tax=Streptomyces sp. HPF1205 TaxID=2873262 RepID=UPI001CED5863|nr:phosphoribosylanthranilate isomerase [Streptomyces sp. HPF1205]
MYVKICGLRTPADVAAAVEAGADAVGFVLTASPRRVAPEQVRGLVALVPEGVLTVAVFRDEPLDLVLRQVRAAGVAAVQLHGDHAPRAFAELREAAAGDGGLVLVRATSAASAAASASASAFSAASASAADAAASDAASAAAVSVTAPGGSISCGSHGEDLLILDSPEPGSGASWDWSALREAPPAGRWMLAGGLTPHNVAHAIAAARPWGVDVSSGVEAERGVKDHRLIADFVARAKGRTGPARAH